jgi:hypothetical protein
LRRHRRRHGLRDDRRDIFAGDFQSLMDELLSEDLPIERYMTYIVTREIKSAQPDLARLATSRPA